VALPQTLGMPPPPQVSATEQTLLQVGVDPLQVPQASSFAQ